LQGGVGVGLFTTAGIQHICPVGQPPYVVEYPVYPASIQLWFRSVDESPPSLNEHLYPFPTQVVSAARDPIVCLFLSPREEMTAVTPITTNVPNIKIVAISPLRFLMNEIIVTQKTKRLTLIASSLRRQESG
jgi:hypothetical protein